MDRTSSPELPLVLSDGHAIQAQLPALRTGKRQGNTSRWMIQAFRWHWRRLRPRTSPAASIAKSIP